MPRDAEGLVAGLNPQQEQAVRHTDGPLLILAGAGAGKTRVITTRIAYLLASGRAAPNEVLAVTFTNKAAEEMRERIGELAGKDRVKGMVVSTFHAFCVRVLRAEIEQLGGYRRNFTITSEGDVRTLLRRSLDDMDGVRERFDPGMFLSRISALKSRDEAPPPAPAEDSDASETEQKYGKWLPAIYETYQSALRAANAVDFDDLLLLTLRLWREHPDVLARYQARFRYVLVDEYQDTNRVQYGLLKALTDRHRNVCVVGDDDQSIYSWRGASIENILDFERDFPEAAVVRLEQNYRSTTSILDAANAVIAHNRARRPKKLWSALGRGRKIDHFITGDEEAEANEAVAWLAQIKAKTGASYSDFSVLYRSNQQARPFEIALRQAGIPYVVFGGQEFFERAEIRDVVAYLKIMTNPRDEPACLRIINVPRRGIGDVTLHRVHDYCRTAPCSLAKGLAHFIESGELKPGPAAGLQEFLALWAEFRGKFRDCRGRIRATAGELLERIDYRDELIRTAKDRDQFEARWANVLALLEAIEQYETSNRRPTLAGFLDQSALATDADRFSREERRKTGVHLMTVHAAKGLEFPFVFIAGAEEGLLPHEKCLEGPALEEERRLFYVALTRAKRHATIFEALSRERHGRTRMTKTSRFVGEIPPELVAQTVRAARDMIEASLGLDGPQPKKKKARRRRQP